MERPTPNSRENLELDDRGSSSWEMRSWGSSSSSDDHESKVKRRRESTQAIANHHEDHKSSTKRWRNSNWNSSSSSGKNRGIDDSAAPVAVAVASSSDLNSTFVHADASSFRDLVQRLTGASHDSIKLPVTKASGQGRPNLSKRSASAARAAIQSDRDPPMKQMVIKSLPSKKNLFLKNVMTDLLSPKSPLSLALNSSPSSSASSSSSSSRHQQQRRELPAAMDRMFLQLESPRPSTKLELLPLFPMH